MDRGACQAVVHGVTKIWTRLSDFYFTLKSRRLIPPASFFFLKIALAIWGLLGFHANYKIFCCSSVKNAIVNLEIALNL